VSEALDRFGEVDILHDNGVWLLHNHRLAVIAGRRSIPRLVSTRGMLEPWAIRHKRLKKKLAWRLYQERDLKQARCLVASNDSEARNLQKFGLDVHIAIIPNGVDVPYQLPDKVASVTKDGDERKKIALFLGRIYPIKGLPMLIQAWARTRPKGWVLRIAGPDEAGHQRQVERAVSDAGLRDVVSFTGPVEAETRKSVFLDADLFVLPSHSESFGMVVAEALAHGLPTLTTTATPWSILRDKSCGWWVNPTVEGIAEGLYEATRLDTPALRAMGARGRTLIGEEFSWRHIADRMLSTYDDVLSRSARVEKRSMHASGLVPSDKTPK
jgi:glycosyltransferase involved in cell wall biosynthesis